MTGGGEGHCVASRDWTPSGPSSPSVEKLTRAFFCMRFLSGDTSCMFFSVLCVLSTYKSSPASKWRTKPVVTSACKVQTGKNSLLVLLAGLSGLQYSSDAAAGLGVGWWRRAWKGKGEKGRGEGCVSLQLRLLATSVGFCTRYWTYIFCPRTLLLR